MVGAGAIGGFIAAALARSGVAVTAIARGPHLEAIARDGIEVESEIGPFVARVEAAADLRDVAPGDVALLTFKAHQWPGFIEQLAPLSGTAATIVTLQNGLPFWFAREKPLASVDPGGRIAALFGDDQIVGGVVHSSSNIGRPGLVRQSGGLRFLFGEPGGAPSPRVDRLAATFCDAGLAGEARTDIRAKVWNKLTNNAGLNPVSALSRATVHTLLRDPGTRGVVAELFREATQTGRACGTAVDGDVEERLRTVGRLADVKTSMLQDVEAQRPLELDPILGAVVELAERSGVDVPISHAIYALTSLLERQA